MQQGSEEWHLFRLDHIGASEVPSLMGVGFKTPLQVYKEKVEGQKQLDNIYMKRGRDLEETARLKYEEMTGTVVFQNVGESQKVPYMSASLDGLSLCKKHAVEIKCPGAKDHQVAKEGRIPKKYYPQLQAQMFVFDLPKIDYFSYSEEDCYIITVQRDEEYIEEMLEVCEKFWNCVLTKTPPVSEIQLPEGFDPNTLVHAMEELRKWEAVVKEEKEKWSQLEQEGTYGRVRVSRRERAGSVQYDRIPQLMGIDLTLYRSDPISYWNIEVLKEKC